jgi:ATP-binding cassette subfamily B protein RaxB
MSLSFLSNRRKVETVLQNEASECGLACLTMVANYHRHDISLAYLRGMFPLSRAGMTLAQMVEVADKLDLDASGYGVSKVAELANLACPAVLHWNGNHFVVLEKVENGRYHIQDPAFGKRVYDGVDIERYFAGVAMEFEPRVAFQKIREERRATVWSVFKSCRGLESVIAQVAIASITASLMQLGTPILLEVSLDTVIPQFDLDLLNVVAIGLALVMLFEAAARWLRDLVTLRASTLFQIHFSRNIVGHAFRLPLSYFENRHPGDFVTRLSSIDNIRAFLVGGFVSSVADSAMSALTIALMFYYSTAMTVVSLTTLLVILVLRMAAFPKVAEFTSATLEAHSEEQARLLDGLHRVDSLKVHNASDLFVMKWFDSFVRYANTDYRTRKVTVDTDFALHVVFMLGTVATLYLGVTGVMQSHLSVGILYAFFSLRTSFFNNINALVLNLMQLSVMKAHFARLDDIIDQQPEQVARGSGVDRALHRGVSLQNVSIRFGQSETLLSGVTLDIDIAKSESIAIVGASGSGKSSLLKVIASIAPAAGGSILVDGQPLDQFGVREYRAHLGAVFADDGVFAGTVAENLAMFDSSIRFEDMEHALATVGLLEEVRRLPQGFATPLSEESRVMSTGQRRRLLLARALCRRPRLLLLDEVTANLDPATEAQLVRGLLATRAAKVFVTHSEKLLPFVDRVYRVAEGRVFEDKLGTRLSA